MFIEGLIPTQQGLRQTITQMVKYIKCSGIWDQKALNNYSHGFAPLINLSMFPDKKIYVHDGHHRITATVLGGRDFLYSQEYVLQQWTYEQYLEINLDVGWLTPYDPRTHCRKSDFRQYKKKILALPPEEAVKTILNSKDEYLEPRTIHNFKEFIANSRCDW
jgi:hypothetical protein